MFTPPRAVATDFVRLDGRRFAESLFCGANNELIVAGRRGDFRNEIPWIGYVDSRGQHGDLGDLADLGTQSPPAAPRFYSAARIGSDVFAILNEPRPPAAHESSCAVVRLSSSDSMVHWIPGTTSGDGWSHLFFKILEWSDGVAAVGVDTSGFGNGSVTSYRIELFTRDLHPVKTLMVPHALGTFGAPEYVSVVRAARGVVLVMREAQAHATEIVYVGFAGNVIARRENLGMVRSRRHARRPIGRR